MALPHFTLLGRTLYTDIYSSHLQQVLRCSSITAIEEFSPAPRRISLYLRHFPTLLRPRTGALRHDLLPLSLTHYREPLISCNPRMEDARGLTKRLLPCWNWASGGRAATALPACCSPAAPAMLRRSYDGVTKGFKGNQAMVTVSGRSGRRDELARNQGACRGLDAILTPQPRVRRASFAFVHSTRPL